MPDNKNAGSERSTDGVPSSAFENVIVGNNGKLINEEQYDLLVDPNCGWCMKPFSFADIVDDPSVIGDWTDDDTFLCADCCNACAGYTYGAFKH